MVAKVDTACYNNINVSGIVSKHVSNANVAKVFKSLIPIKLEM